MALVRKLIVKQSSFQLAVQGVVEQTALEIHVESGFLRQGFTNSSGLELTG